MHACSSEQTNEQSHSKTPGGGEQGIGEGPGLIAQQGALSKEVGFEEVVDLAGALGGGLVHHRLPLLDDVKQVAGITLHVQTVTIILSLIQVVKQAHRRTSSMRHHPVLHGQQVYAIR